MKDRLGWIVSRLVKKRTSKSQRGLPTDFIDRFGQHVTGFISGLDRVRFRATLRPLFCPNGPEVYLSYCKVLIKNFKDFAQGVSERVKKLAYESFQQAGRPSIYLPSWQLSKEALIEELIGKEPIERGPIALLSCVEPCLAFRVRRDAQSKRIGLVMGSAKCTHLYHYYQHPQVGLMHVRVQSWFPFNVEVCINGRRWLARQMDQAGIAYRQHDNCFVWIEDYEAAQKLLDKQLRSNWSGLMNSFLDLAHPLHQQISAPMAGLTYYWSASQSEYATDVLFKHSRELQELYPKFLRHAISSFRSPDVMRFLGKSVPQSGQMRANCQAQISSRLQQRPEGVRIRHSLNGNSLKMYDKEGSVLRVETTIVRPREFKVYRSKELHPGSAKQWYKLRSGVSDMYRRAQVCRASNARYLQALASVTGSNSVLQEASQLCEPIVCNGKRHRALNPLRKQDYALLSAVSDGQFVLAGVRNRDLRALLYPPLETAPANKKELRRRSAAVTRQLALLRAHGLLRKLPRTHRYQITPKGRRIITALLAACHAGVEQLTPKAA